MRPRQEHDAFLVSVLAKTGESGENRRKFAVRIARFSQFATLPIGRVFDRVSHVSHVSRVIA